MKEYMTTLGVILMLISFANMLIPEGSIKKYTSLAMGFMLICSALSFLPSKKGVPFFSAEQFSFPEEEIENNEALYRAQVLKKHRENLEETIEGKLKNGGKAFVEVSPDGEVISVTLWVNGDESGAVRYIIENFGIGRERIKLKNDKN